MKNKDCFFTAHHIVLSSTSIDQTSGHSRLVPTRRFCTGASSSRVLHGPMVGGFNGITQWGDKHTARYAARQLCLKIRQTAFHSMNFSSVRIYSNHYISCIKLP
jgi:hypothetical protein